MTMPPAAPAAGPTDMHPGDAEAIPPLTAADLAALEQEYASAPPANDVRRLLAEVRRLQTAAGASEAPSPRDSKVLSIPELRWLVGAALCRKDRRVRLADAAYRQFVDTVAQAVGAALGYDCSPADDFTGEWLLTFYLTGDTPPDGGILADPRFDPDVQADFLAGVAARRQAGRPA